MTSPRVLQKMNLDFGTVVQELQATVLELDTLGKIIHKKNELLQAQTAEIEHQREEIKQLREALTYIANHDHSDCRWDCDIDVPVCDTMIARAALQKGDNS